MALFSARFNSLASSTFPPNPNVKMPFVPICKIRAVASSPRFESPDCKTQDGLLFKQYAATKMKRVNHELDMAVPLRQPVRLTQSMRHTLLAESERISSLLCIASCELMGGNESQAMGTACAFEMIHAMSLVHDDLPCMDDADLRRGKPANHKMFDEATALLAGDALFSIAFEHIARHTKNVQPERILKVILELSTFSGPEGIQAGQMMDKLCEGREDVSQSELEFIHMHKAAKCTGGAIVCGAILAGGTEDEIEWMRRFGLKVGFLFQVLDDIIDVTKSSQELGKTTGNDFLNNKLTFPKLMGTEGAEKYASQMFDEVLQELSSFDAERAAPLRGIITYVFNRQYM